jgi:hypothetical protein
LTFACRTRGTRGSERQVRFTGIRRTILAMAAAPHFRLRETRPFLRLGQPELPVEWFKFCQSSA